mmetsp:Transcript_9048/g.19540  ORF Transcript_9048/g.19540 Transcript_9048/m.19540 type:complete len:101 (-) Transcript_9048:45-347(-)
MPRKTNTRRAQQLVATTDPAPEADNLPRSGIFSENGDTIFEAATGCGLGDDLKCVRDFHYPLPAVVRTVECRRFSELGMFRPRLIEMRNVMDVATVRTTT